LVLPSGIATDDSTSAFFGEISKGRIVQLVDFENREGLFAGVHRSFKFCLLTIGSAEAARFAFFLGNTEQLKDPRRSFTLTAEDITRLNPNTRTCPVFRSQKDAEITSGIYKRVPVLWDENKPYGNPWGIKFMTMFHMSGDSEHFRDIKRRDELEKPMPLYEPKLIYFYDHRYATFEDCNEIQIANGTANDFLVNDKKSGKKITPRYWLEEEEVHSKISDKFEKDKFTLCFRGVTSVTNERTMISAFIPLYGAQHNLQLIRCQGGMQHAALICANLNSIILDFVCRNKMGSYLSLFCIKQLPLIPLQSYPQNLIKEIIFRVAELSCTNDEMQGLITSFGVEQPESGYFVWNEERRSTLRSELDAIYARLYGLTRDDLRYILHIVSSETLTPTPHPDNQLHSRSVNKWSDYTIICYYGDSINFTYLKWKRYWNNGLGHTTPDYDHDQQYMLFEPHVL
jgi:hypothetical protein